MSKLLHSFLIISIFAGVLFSSPLKGHSEDQIQSTSNYLTVVPPKVELWTEQGKDVKQTLKITNESDQDALIALSLESFSITEDEGLAVLGKNFSLPNEIISWITFDNKATQIKAKETKYINYTIKTPENAYPGGNYAAIVVSMDKVHRAPNEGTALARVVSLIMLSVAGDIRDNTEIDKFDSSITQKNNQRNIDFYLRLKNKGNNHIRPKGSIVITNVFGKKITEIPLEGENVLPNTYRSMTTTWKPGFLWYGRYSAHLVFKYGFKGDKYLSSVTNFYIWPKWYVVVSFLILIFLIISLIQYVRQKE